jgi:hypothetical protein
MAIQAAQRDSGRMRISRPIVAALGIAIVASAVFVGVATAPRPAPRPLAPVVYYEVLGAHENVLLEQPLDGTSPARVVASRPSTGEGQVRWEVDPSGTVGMAVTLRGAGVVVEAVEVASGRALWRRELERIPRPGVWSRDGRLWASNTETPDGMEGHILAVVNVAAGTVALSRTEQTWSPQGFTADGDLVLTEEVDNEQGYVTGWAFRLRHRATGVVAPVNVAMAGTGPRGGGGLSDVATTAGWAVRRSLQGTPETGTTQRLELVEFRTGEVTLLGPAEDTNYNWFALTPDASRVLALTYVEEVDGESTNALLVIDREGEGAEIWRGPMPIDHVISRAGRYIGMTSWVGHSLLTVVHLGSGRSLEIPLPPRTIAGVIRTIVDPADVDLIAVAPLRPPASADPAPAARPLAGVPRFISALAEETGDGWAGRVSILAPGEGGGIAVVETMPPLQLPVPDPFVEVHPRPGTDEVLVAVISERPSLFWLWTPGRDPVELDLPDNLPPNASQPRWRPDGGAIAFNYWKQIGDDVESGIAILGLASRDVRVIPTDGPYGDLADWASDGRRPLLSYQVCVEGCPGRYAFVARLDPDTGVVTPFDVGDRDAAGYLAYHDDAGRTIILTSIQLEEADDVVLRWPAELAPLSGGIDWSSDRRNLVVSTTTDDVVTLYRVPDVLAGGPGAFDAQPVKLGILPAGVSPQTVSAGREWVIAADRAYTRFLIKLSTGESWEMGSFANGQLSWLPEG